MNCDDIVLLGLKHSVTAFSKNEGRVLWKTELDGGLGTGFVTVIADQHRVFAHSGGSLFCLDLTNGQTLWSDGLSGYGYGLATLSFPGGSTAPDTAAVEQIAQESRSHNANSA